MLGLCLQPPASVTASLTWGFFPLSLFLLPLEVCLCLKEALALELD